MGYNHRYFIPASACVDIFRKMLFLKESFSLPAFPTSRGIISYVVSVPDFVLRIVFLSFICVLFSFSAYAAEEGQWDRIIEGKVLTKTLTLDGSGFDNSLLRNLVIKDVKGDGILLRNVNNVRIENIQIYDVTGNGIRLSMSGSTSDVIIEGNRIIRAEKNGINAGQRHKKGVDHKGLIIRNNVVKDTGLSGFRGLHHGIYVQAQDFYIAGNMIINAADGNGISVRSSGVVENNIIKGAGKSGIAYYADHMSGVTKTLIVRGNEIADIGRKVKRAAIDVLPPKHEEYSVHMIEIKDNVFSMPRGIRVHEFYDQASYTVTVE